MWESLHHKKNWADQQLNVGLPNFIYVEVIILDDSMLITGVLRLGNPILGVEVIEEYDVASVGGFALPLDFAFHAHGSLGCAAEVEDFAHGNMEANTAANDHGLLIAEVLDAVVNLVLDVADINNLLPEVGEDGESEVAVGNGVAEGRLTLSLLNVDVDPLMVECGIGKEVNLLLSKLVPIGNAEFLTYQGFEVGMAIND